MSLSRRQMLQASLIAGLWRPAELAAQSLVTADVIAETRWDGSRRGRRRGQHFQGCALRGERGRPRTLLASAASGAMEGLRDWTKTGARAIQAPACCCMNPLIGESLQWRASDRAKVAEQAESENCRGLKRADARPDGDAAP